MWSTPAPGDDLGRRLARIETHAQALFDRVDRMARWPAFHPSVATHRLLACGRSCSSPDDTASFLEAWFDGAMHEDDLHLLHRGELLALAADLGLPLETTVSFTSGSSTTLHDLLQEAQRALDVPPPTPWNPREQRKGPEYGWLLQAFCTYLGPTAPLNETWSVEDLIASITAQGINTRTEAGTHELEGLATCLHQHTARGPATTSPAYAALAQILTDRLQADLDQITPDGQLYPDAPNFSRCVEENAGCRLLTDIIRQAHFLEWAALVPGFASEDRVPLVLARLDVLLERAHRDLDEAWIDRHALHPALVLAATSHTLHALQKLHARGHRLRVRSDRLPLHCRHGGLDL